MGFNLTAFIGGAAGKATELVDEERKQQKDIVTARLQKAAESKAVYDRETEAQRKVLTTTYSTLSQQAGFNDLTPAQQASILSSTEISADYITQSKAGKPVDVASRYNLAVSTAAGTETPEQMVKNFGVAPTSTLTDEEVDKSMGTGIFSKSTDQANAIATAFGGATAKDLLAYEGATAPTLQPTASFAEGALEVPETIAESMELALQEIRDATTPEEKSAAEAKQQGLLRVQALSAPADSLENLVKKLEMDEFNEKDPTKKAELRKQQTVLNKQIKIRAISQKEDRAGTKPGGLTYAEMSKAINNAIDQSIGKIKGSDKFARVDKDGNPARPSSQMPPDMAEKAKAGALRWLRQNNLLDSNGAPIGADATAIITSYGYWSPDGDVATETVAPPVVKPAAPPAVSVVPVPKEFPNDPKKQAEIEEYYAKKNRQGSK
tara:strand:+ start:848 stop:2155 length:1308 start_codon:yes stop_codon:yes gene_type:complete